MTSIPRHKLRSEEQALLNLSDAYQQLQLQARILREMWKGTRHGLYLEQQASLDSQLKGIADQADRIRKNLDALLSLRKNDRHFLPTQ